MTLNPDFNGTPLFDVYSVIANTVLYVITKYSEAKYVDGE